MTWAQKNESKHYFIFKCNKCFMGDQHITNFWPIISNCSLILLSLKMIAFVPLKHPNQLRKITAPKMSIFSFMNKKNPSSENP